MGSDLQTLHRFPFVVGRISYEAGHAQLVFAEHHFDQSDIIRSVKKLRKSYFRAKYCIVG